MPRYKIGLHCKPFKRNIKHLEKKFQEVKNDPHDKFVELENGVRMGNRIPLIDAPVFIVRMKNSSSKRGASSGFRLIYKLEEERGIIYPLLLYSKTEKEIEKRSKIEIALRSLDRGLFDEE